MKRHWISLVFTLLGFFFGSFAASGQEPSSSDQGAKKSDSPRWYDPRRYNPAKLVRRDSKTASDRLADDGDLENKLTSQLRAAGALPKDVELQDACSTFKYLIDCIGALRATNNLDLEFNCLKFDLTGIDPDHGNSSCAGPPGGKPATLSKSIQLLKPDADARAEAKNAVRQARADISDASS